MNEIKVKSIYKHFKGNLYLVEDIATHSETREKYVVYSELSIYATLFFSLVESNIELL